MSLVEEAVTTEMGEGAPIFEGTRASHCSECGSPLLPAALKSETGSAIRLRCFVRQAGPRLYVAECIDLDLAAESESLDGAVNGLRDAMVGYLLVVLDGVETDQEAPAAVLRPSPLSHRVRYYFEYLKYRLSELIFRHHRRSRKFYSTPYGLGGSQCHI